MKCPKCGAELEDDAFFCDKCGSVVSADTDEIDLFSASEEKDDESGSLDFKAGDTSAHSGGGDFFSKLHKSGGVAAKAEPAEVTSGGNFYNNVSRSGIINNGVNDRAADAENAEMAAAAAGFYSNTGKSDAINNGMNSRATDAESAEMAAVAAGFYSNTGKSEAISNGMNSRSADAESPEVVAAAAGFYSSANKGKTTDANNSVVFDAKIDDDELSQISIDKVKEVTDIAPDLYHGKLDVPDEELEQEDESKYAADLVTGEIKVSEEEQAQENEEESKYAADLVSGPLNVPDEELAQEDESKYAADLVTGKLDIPDEELAQEDESQYAAKLNTDEIKDDENSEESELDKKIQEDTSKAVGEGTAEQKKNEGKKSSAEKVNLIQVLVNFFREITSEDVEEEEIEADDVQGNFEYLSGSAENEMKGYLPLCFAPMASLLLLGFVEGLVQVIIELAGFGALIGAFVKTPKMRMKIAQAFAKTDVFNFTRYVSEIKKQMNSALVFSAIGLVIMICSLIDDGGQVQNLVLLLGILISSLGYCLAVNSGVRCIIVKDAFAKIREEKRPKKTYTDQVNIACFALCIVALLVFVFVKFAGVI